jgi:hypothetical protein
MRAITKRRNALIATHDVFSALRNALPLLIPGISRYTTDGLPILHPGLFATIAQIDISTAAIELSTKLFTDHGHLPTLPVIISNSSISRGACFALMGVFNPVLPVPPHVHLREVTMTWQNEKLGEHRLPDEAIARAVASIHTWLASARTSLRSELSIAETAFPPDYLLRIMRGLWFIGSHGTEMDVTMNELFKEFVNIFSFAAIFRYSKLVLEPLLADIDRMRGVHLPDLTPLTKSAVTLIKRWNLYFAPAAPAALSVSSSLTSSRHNANSQLIPSDQRLPSYRNVSIAPVIP